MWVTAFCQMTAEILRYFGNKLNTIIFTDKTPKSSSITLIEYNEIVTSPSRVANLFNNFIRKSVKK